MHDPEKSIKEKQEKVVADIASSGIALGLTLAFSAFVGIIVAAFLFRRFSLADSGHPILWLTLFCLPVVVLFCLGFAFGGSQLEKRGKQRLAEVAVQERDRSFLEQIRTLDDPADWQRLVTLYKLETDEVTVP